MTETSKRGRWLSGSSPTSTSCTTSRGTRPAPGPSRPKAPTPPARGSHQVRPLTKPVWLRKVPQCANRVSYIGRADIFLMRRWTAVATTNKHSKLTFSIPKVCNGILLCLRGWNACYFSIQYLSNFDFTEASLSIHIVPNRIFIQHYSIGDSISFI